MNDDHPCNRTTRDYDIRLPLGRKLIAVVELYESNIIDLNNSALRSANIHRSQVVSFSEGCND